MLLRLLTIRLTYRIANALWEPHMSPVFCGIKGNDLLLIITPQSRSGSGRMSGLTSSQRQFSVPNFIRVSSEKVVQREASVSEVVR